MRLHRRSRCFPVTCAAAGIAAPLLPAQLERGLVEMQLPAPCNFWLLEEDGNPIGRIGANVSCRSAQTGYVGLL